MAGVSDRDRTFRWQGGTVSCVVSPESFSRAERRDEDVKSHTLQKWLKPWKSVSVPVSIPNILLFYLKYWNILQMWDLINELLCKKLMCHVNAVCTPAIQKKMGTFLWPLARSYISMLECQQTPGSGQVWLGPVWTSCQLMHYSRLMNHEYSNIIDENGDMERPRGRAQTQASSVWG